MNIFLKFTSLSLYHNPRQIQKQETIFKEIEDRFYHNLSEEEKLYIDAQKAITLTYLNKDTADADQLLNDYFFQLCKNELPYTENDLMIILLYFHVSFEKKMDIALFETLLSCMTQQAKNACPFRSNDY